MLSTDFEEVKWGGAVDEKGEYYGAGKMTHPYGRIFEGTYENGVKSGPGKISHSNGDLFEGTFVNG